MEHKRQYLVLGTEDPGFAAFYDRIQREFAHLFPDQITIGIGGAMTAIATICMSEERHANVLVGYGAGLYLAAPATNPFPVSLSGE